MATIEFRTCSRSEFFRRAKLQFPFLTEMALAKVIQRGHIHPERPHGGFCKFNERSWDDLEQYIALRSRSAQRLLDQAGHGVFCRGVR